MAAGASVVEMEVLLRLSRGIGRIVHSESVAVQDADMEREVKYQGREMIPALGIGV
jgi:hypothetical protein